MSEVNKQMKTIDEENKETFTATEKKQKQKRGIIVAFSVMLAIVLVTYIIIPGIGMIADMIADQKDDGYKSDYMDDIKSLSFYPADYNENIYEDKEYMDKNRYLSYEKGGDTFTITNGDYAFYGPTIEFFAEYFDAVINGEYETYNDFFTEAYFEKQSNKSRFTPQKLYDINVKYKSTTALEGDVTSYIYYVDYKIFENNGTFRNDIESDASRTLVYELHLYPDGKVLINYIGR